ncbi:MAG: molybdopterin molybdotransferase [Alphaproteobacteria bacterium]|jgi:molybdopterin biosynthesis enzyme|nr:molybdopterin molybdotransferase [Alphaproteobacteria bacterium]
MAGEPENQRILCLTPLADVVARIEALVKPVAAREVGLAAALLRVLAEDVVAPAGVPAQARALGDGYAVRAEDTADGGSYAPAPFAARPPRVDVGDVMPPGADAVAPLDSVVERDGRFAAVAPVAPGEGVLPINADLEAGAVLHRAGERLSAVDLAVLAAAGIDRVRLREPRIRLVKARPDRDLVLDSAVQLLARAATAAGCDVQVDSGDLATALTGEGADAVIAVGGTGSGRNDASVRTLAGIGRVEVHGVALVPGETTAFGFVGARPVLLVPGRLDAALAAWLVLGRRLLARLSACVDSEPTISGPLARKVASPPGLAEVVPVRLRAGRGEPIASGYWPLQAMAQADGWILVPAESEGFPAGAEVVVRRWP